MRLIDADVLVKHKVTGEIGNLSGDFVPGFAIANAPTIKAEPVRHGRWIHDINNLYGCSKCFGRETMSHKKLKPYCPNCGAKMGKKEEPTCD